eukprot:SAG31_NODE_6114_length_2165_cov_1.826234_1_plen_165_part_00
MELVAASHGCDRSRLYLTGLSMGGMGSWTLLSAYPSLFAAAAPICGAFIPVPSPDVAAVEGPPGGFEGFRLRRHPTAADAEKLSHLPLCIVHGAKDEAVPVAGSIEMFEMLKSAGAQKAKLLIYPDVDGRVGHDSWTQTLGLKQLAQCNSSFESDIYAAVIALT